MLTSQRFPLPEKIHHLRVVLLTLCMERDSLLNNFIRHNFIIGWCKMLLIMLTRTKEPIRAMMSTFRKTGGLGLLHVPRHPLLCIISKHG